MKIELDETQCQIIMLAMANLVNECPGWEDAIEKAVERFPQKAIYRNFIDIKTGQLLQAISTIGEKQ